MAKLVPSILEETKDKFLDTMSRELKLPGVERLQVDFGDGAFIDRRLLSAEAMDTLNPAFEWEAHLMIKEPKDFLDYKIAGFQTVLIHYEAFDNSRDLHHAIDKIKAEGLKPALVINPGTPVDVLKNFSNIINHFQIMGVHPGYQGQEFIPNTIERTGHLRKLIPNAIIEVDGGVNMSNVKQLAQAGADMLILGSAITKAQDMLEAWEKLNAEISK